MSERVRIEGDENDSEWYLWYPIHSHLRRDPRYVILNWWVIAFLDVATRYHTSYQGKKKIGKLIATMNYETAIVAYPEKILSG